MDMTIALTNATACMVLSLAAGWACLSSRVRDGVVIKLGLIAMAIGFFVHAWIMFDGVDLADAVAMARAQFVINAGMLIVVLGWLVRTRGGRDRKRRTTDWADLDGAAPDMAADAEGAGK